MFFAHYFLKVHLHHFSKMKSHKEVKKTVGIKVFLTFSTYDRRILVPVKHTLALTIC